MTAEIANLTDDSAGYVPEVLATPKAQSFIKIANVALLTPEQEIELAKAIEAGVLAQEKLDLDAGQLDERDRADYAALADLGAQAMQHFIEANQRLVAKFAKSYLGRGVPLPDLIQGGNEGLIKAVRKFDYTKGFKFSTFAAYSIRKAIYDTTVKEGRNVSLPRHVHGRLYRLRHAEEKLGLALDRPPTYDELAKETGLPAEQIRKLKDHRRPSVSLDMPVGDGDSVLQDRIAEQLPDGDDPIERVDRSLAYADMMRIIEDTGKSGLTERQVEIIKLRAGFYGHVYTQAEIARMYGVSRERISEQEKQAYKKLREKLGRDLEAFRTA